MAVGGRDEDRVTRVLSLPNEEPLVVVKSRVDVMREIIREDCCNGGDRVVRERKTALCRSGHWFSNKGPSRTEDRDVGRDGCVSSHWGSEVFSSGRCDEDVIGVNGDIFVEWGEEESIKKFLRNLWQSGRHRR